MAHASRVTRHAPALALSGQLLRVLRVSVGLLLLFLLGGCGSRDHTLRVRLPAGTVVHRGASVFLDGVEVGEVAQVGRDGSKVLATVVITELDVARRKLRPGLIATVNADRGIDLDSGEIDRRAEPLPSGATIEGTTKFDLMVRRYARWQTVVVFFLGALGVLIVFWIFRTFFKIGWVVVALALAAAVASIVHRPVTSLVEQVTVGEEAPAPSDAEPPGDGEEDTSILDVPRPSPGMVAFFVSWLAAFVAIQLTVGAALRATGRKR